MSDQKPLTIQVDREGTISSADETAVSRFGHSLTGRHLSDLLSTGETNTTWQTVSGELRADVCGTVRGGQITLELSEPGAGDETHARRRFDDLLRITTDVVRADSAVINEKITQALGRIGRLTRVDRAYVFLFDDDGIHATNTHEWTRAGTEPQIIALQRIPRDHFDWFEEAMKRDGYLLLRSLEDVPGEGESGRELLEAQGITSLLAIGMFRKEILTGFIGFDATSPRVRWSPRTIERLTLIAELFTQSILRAETELELEAANETFDLVRHATNDVIWDWNLETDHVWYSEALENLLGFAPDATTSRSEWWFERIHPDDRAGVIELLETPELTHCQSEYRVRHRTGEWVYVLDRWQITRDDQGRAKRIVGITTNITRRIEAAERLRESEARFRAVVENVSDVIAILDRNGTIVYESPSAAGTLGYSPKELEGSSAFELIHPDDRERVVQRFVSAIEAGRRLDQTTFRYRHGRGHWIDVETVGVNLIDEGSINGIVIATRDITSRRRIEQQLERTNRLASLGHLASGIAHEFNNVLMGMQPFVDLIQRTDDLQHIRTSARRIDAAIDRGKSISRGIMGFTRPLNVSLETIDLRSWLLSLEEEIRHLLPGTTSLRISISDEKVQAIVDPTTLHQAILNILLWSRDLPYDQSPRGVEITVRPPREGDRVDHLGELAQDAVLIVLSLEGTILEGKMKEHLFDPMFAARDGSGSGLGLAVVKQLISAQKGDVFSESDEERTIFTICLRSAIEDDTDQATPVSTGTPAVSNTILLVEDDELVASGISALLEVDGHHVRVATRGERAIEILAQERPSIVILDIGLPDMSGTEVFERVMEAYPNLPVVFSSGHGDQQEIKHYLERPNVEFLLKPYDATTLLTLVEKLTSADNLKVAGSF